LGLGLCIFPASEQVLEVARAGNLLSGDGTINLIQYTAFLAGEVGASGTS